MIKFEERFDGMQTKIMACSTEETKNNRDVECYYSIGRYIKKEIEVLQQELDKYKNNWEELKKWLKEDKELAENNFEMGRCFNMFDILNKMKELEEKNND